MDDIEFVDDTLFRVLAVDSVLVFIGSFVSLFFAINSVSTSSTLVEFTSFVVLLLFVFVLALLL
jgi:hypothetical protein